jgi:prepilin signal peptidase PulO-like enzyme (type II secretory pathway)
MIVSFMAGIFGLLFGSFSNAVVWRLHEQGAGYEPDERPKKTVKSDVSISHGRSMCPHCEHQLSAFDLIPVLSWLMLAGKCRYCHKPISGQYPFVELLMAALFALSAFVLPHDSPADIIQLVVWLGFVVTLVILAVYDARWQLLPDRIVWPTVAAALTMIVVYRLTGWYGPSYVESHYLAATVIGGLFFALHYFSNGKWMGGGDVGLVTLMGLLLGGPKLLVALLIAFNAAAIIGLGLILLGWKKRQDMLAFGPFLIAATIIAQLYGDNLIRWYLHLNGLV